MVEGHETHDRPLDPETLVTMEELAEDLLLLGLADVMRTSVERVSIVFGTKKGGP